jgi:uncharacterized membrane protein YadS
LFYAGKRVMAMRARGERVDWNAIVPWFVLWFLGAAVVNSVFPLAPRVHAAITQCALALIVIALSGVGLSTDARAIRAAGVRPLALGAILWALIAISSLAIAHFAHVA